MRNLKSVLRWNLCLTLIVASLTANASPPGVPDGLSAGGAETLFRYAVHRLVADVLKDATFHENVQVNLSLNVVHDVTAERYVVDPAAIDFDIRHDGTNSEIRSTASIRLDPTYGGTANGIVYLATRIVIENGSGTAISLTNDAHRIAVFPSSGYVRIMGDTGVSFGSNDNSTVFRVDGDAVRADCDGVIEATGALVTHSWASVEDYLRFPATTGDKVKFYTDLYRMGVSPMVLSVSTDKWVHFGSDTHPTTIRFDADAGVIYANNFAGGGGGISDVNADLLDGLDSTQFIRSDADDSFSGVVSGGTGALVLRPEGVVVSPFHRFTPRNMTLDELKAVTQDGDAFFVRAP